MSESWSAGVGWAAIHCVITSNSGLSWPIAKPTITAATATRPLSIWPLFKVPRAAVFSLAEIGEILAAKRGNTIDCAQGAMLVAGKMAEIQAKITTLQAAYVFLDAERAKLEASAIANGLTIPRPLGLAWLDAVACLFAIISHLHLCLVFEAYLLSRMHRVVRSRQTVAAVYIGPSL